MEITKYDAGEVLYHIKHDLRELPPGKKYGNESIDHTLSDQNYSLINRGSTASEINRYRKSLEKEVFKYNRKNLIHAVEVVIQCPSDCPESQKDDFFRESLEYIASTLPRGKKDIFVAEVHKDEKHYSPSGDLLSKDHIHIMYVPAVKDTKHEGFEYKLCADALTKRANLRQLHPGLQDHIDRKGIHATVYQKKNGTGKTISLSVSQMKEITEKTGVVIDHSLSTDELANILSKNVDYEHKIASLTSIVENQELTIHSLSNELDQLQKNNVVSADNISAIQAENQSLKQQISDLQQTLSAKNQELDQAKQRINDLEVSSKKDQTWGVSSDWGNQSGWGNSQNIEEDKTW